MTISTILSVLGEGGWIVPVVLVLFVIASGIYGYLQSKSGSVIGGNSSSNPRREEDENVGFFGTSGGIAFAISGVCLAAYIVWYLTSN